MTAERAPETGEGLRIARNSALLGVGQVASLALGFATTILVTDALGDRYGLFIGAQRFVGLFLVVMQFGLHPLLVRAVAAGRDAPGALLATTLALRSVLGGAFALLVVTGSLLGGYLPDERWVVYAFIPIEITGVFLETFLAMCQGLERMGRAALIASSRSLYTFVGVFAVIGAGGGLREILIVYFVGRALQLVTGIALTFASPGDFRLRVRWQQALPLLREAVPYLAVGYAYAVLRSLDVVLLARIAPIAEAARFGAALNFLEVLFVVPLLVQRSLLPAFSRLEVAGRASSLAGSTIQVFYLMLLPAAVGLGVLADEALALYPSGEFADAAPVLVVLAGVLLFLPPSTIFATHLTGAGRLGRILWSYAAALPVQLAMNLLLIPRYGAVGAAVATVCAHATLSVVLLAAVHSLGVRVPWRSVARYAVAAALMGVGVWGTRGMPVPLSVGIGLSIYLVALYWLVPSDGLERRLLAALTRRGGRS